jgi:hypothetical protein
VARSDATRSRARTRARRRSRSRLPKERSLRGCARTSVLGVARSDLLSERATPSLCFTPDESPRSREHARLVRLGPSLCSLVRLRRGGGLGPGSLARTRLVRWRARTNRASPLRRSRFFPSFLAHSPRPRFASTPSNLTSPLARFTREHALALVERVFSPPPDRSTP